MRKLVLIALVVVFSTVFAASVQAQDRCPNGRSKQGAMWFSIAHPGLGEYFLKGWGPWDRMPQKKFWLGFIPFFGWPGYLQVKSAVDSYHCRTNDDLGFEG